MQVWDPFAEMSNGGKESDERNSVPSSIIELGSKTGIIL